MEKYFLFSSGLSQLWFSTRLKLLKKHLKDLNSLDVQETLCLPDDMIFTSGCTTTKIELFRLLHQVGPKPSSPSTLHPPILTVNTTTSQKSLYY